MLESFSVLNQFKTRKKREKEEALQTEPLEAENPGEGPGNGRGTGIGAVAQRPPHSPWPVTRCHPRAEKGSSDCSWLVPHPSQASDPHPQILSCSGGQEWPDRRSPCLGQPQSREESTARFLLSPELRQAWIQAWLLSLPAVWPWANYSALLSPGFMHTHRAQ